MAKRHAHDTSFVSRIRRMQELIMSRSGIDEFYEIVRLIVAKFLAEQDGKDELPDRKTCDRLLMANRDRLAFAFDDNMELQTPNDVFGDIQTAFRGVSISGQGFDALDHAFELLTSRHYKADKGQYFTPRHVIDMCVRVIAPAAGELICDPACGSAAFLHASYGYSVGSTHGSARLFGFDYSHRACQIAQIVSFISTGGAISIQQLDSLKKKTEVDDHTIESIMGPTFAGFDAILTNPPFAGDVAASAFARDYELAMPSMARIERDILFVERCIGLLKEGGRLAIVLPDNKVSSKVFRDVRVWLSRNSAVKAVVSLHRYTFLPYTSQKAVVLFAVKGGGTALTHQGAIQFFRSDKPGKTSNGSPVYRPGADVNAPPYFSLDHDLEQAVEPIREAMCAA